MSYIANIRDIDPLLGQRWPHLGHRLLRWPTLIQHCINDIYRVHVAPVRYPSQQKTLTQTQEVDSVLPSKHKT